MTPTCEQQRERMVDHLLGELDGLVAQRLEAHLDNCEACAQVYARLEAGFAAARRFEPSIDDEELGRLSSRLDPYLEPAAGPERPRLGFWALTLGGAAAVAAAVMLLVQPGPPPASEAALVVADFASKTASLVEPVREPKAPEGPVQQRSMSEHLRAVTSADFAGQVTRPEPDVTALDIERGFAVLDFEGGSQRVLRVTAKDVKVRVLGTRLFVEARAGAPTTVGVVSGRIEVTSGGQVEILGAGQVRAYDAAGAYTPDRANLRSAAHHEDAFLARPKDEAPPKVAKRRPKRPPLDPVAALTKAEGLVREGRVEVGLRVYDRLISSSAPAALRELARYERARVWGFVKRDRRRAAAAFEVLAREASPEVRRQAALARCELDVGEDLCAAATCLRALESEGRYVSEVQALLRSWSVSGDTCSDSSRAHKSDPGSRRTK